MKIGQNVNVVYKNDGRCIYSGVYACEDHTDYFIVVNPGGLTQILTFSKVFWNLKKTEGFTDIHEFLEDKKEYIKALYGVEGKHMMI